MRLTLVCALIVCLLTGCSSATAGGGNESTNTLRVRTASAMLSTDPFKEIGSNSWQLLRQVYEGLVSLDDNLDPIPMLARSWDKSADGKRYTFHLRQGVEFHNGKEMTASDVKYSLDYYRKNATRKSGLAHVASVRAVDRYTVEVDLSTPQGSLIEVLAQPIVVAIVPKGSADDGGLVKKPVGTGPFEVEQFVSEKRATLARFRDYKPVNVPTSNFGGRKVAKVDRIQLLSVEEGLTAVAGIETGEYDIALDPPSQDLDRIEQMPGVRIQSTPGTGMSNLYINVAAPTIDNEYVRAGILTAIDRGRLARTTTFGQARVEHSYVPPIASWYREDAAAYWPWTGGIDRAKRLLRKGGYHGQTIEVMAGGPDSQQINAVQIEQDLRAAGVRVHIQRLDQTTYQSRLNSGSFQLASTGTPLRTPGDVLYAEWYCAHGKQKGRFGYCNERYDDKFDAAQRIQDPDERADAWAELERMLKDDAVIDPWYTENSVAVVQKNVHGFKASPSDLAALWNVSKTS